jgi:hypothetical protein
MNLQAHLSAAKFFKNAAPPGITGWITGWKNSPRTEPKQRLTNRRLILRTEHDENSLQSFKGITGETVLKARGEGLAVLLNRHERKEGGNVGDSGRGSSAFSGVVDIILRLHRTEGKHPGNIRQLDALSRFDGTPRETTIALNEGRYEIVGTQDAIAQQGAIDKLRSMLPFQKEDAMTLEIMEKVTGSSRTTLQAAISMLEDGGFVARRGAGKRGDSYSYFQLAAGTPGP